MKQRIITALILAPLIIAGIFLLPFFYFVLMLLGVVGLSLWEWSQFVTPKARNKSLFFLLAGALACVAIMPMQPYELGAFGQSSFSFILSGVIWWLIASLLTITYPSSAKHWQDSPLLKGIFGLISLMPFLWSVAVLRAIDYDVNVYYGAKMVLFVCLLVWSADSGAYFAGKSLGKHKMAPRVSPNKTIEGLVGGIIAAIIVGFVFADLLSLDFSSTPAMMVIILATVVISVMGDLVESMFKRVANIKDSSNLIPGHGGVLDRIDSLMAAFPMFTLCYFLLA